MKNEGNTPVVCNVRVGERGELAGGKVGFQGISNGLCRVEAAELQCAVDAHQDRLGGRALLGTIRLAVLPQDHLVARATRL